MDYPRGGFLKLEKDRCCSTRPARKVEVPMRPERLLAVQPSHPCNSKTRPFPPAEEAIDGDREHFRKPQVNCTHPNWHILVHPISFYTDYISSSCPYPSPIALLWFFFTDIFWIFFLFAPFRFFLPSFLFFSPSRKKLIGSLSISKKSCERSTEGIGYRSTL